MMLSYYLRWLKTAFRHSIGPVDLWTGLAASVLGIADRYLPAANIMTTYGWQIPIWALAAVILVRLVLAPFWMATEDGARIASLTKRLDDKKARQDALNELWELRNDGVLMRNEFITSDPRYEEWVTEFERWRERVLAAASVVSVSLRHHLAILNEMGPPPGNISYVSPTHEHQVQVFSEILRRLSSYLEKDL